MDEPMRELTPDEIVADIEAMKPRKRKVTIYQSWPRMILERERKRAQAASPEALDVLRLRLDGIRKATEELRAGQWTEDFGTIQRACSDIFSFLDETDATIRAALSSQPAADIPAPAAHEPYGDWARDLIAPYRDAKGTP